MQSHELHGFANLNKLLILLYLQYFQGVHMKKFLTLLAASAMISASAFAQVEINYAKEGGDTKYDAIKFFSADGKYAANKDVTMVVFTDKMHPLASEVTPDGPASMNGVAKCLVHSGSGTSFWANMAKDANGAGQNQPNLHLYLQLCHLSHH